MTMMIVKDDLIAGRTEAAAQTARLHDDAGTRHLVERGAMGTRCDDVRLCILPLHCLRST